MPLFARLARWLQRAAPPVGRAAACLLLGLAAAGGARAASYTFRSDSFAWETTVAEQRARNVHVHDGVDEAAFVALRRKRDAGLSAPVLLLPSVQVNIRAGQLPPAEAFKDAESYAATKAHEPIHWTGSAGRCAREFGKRFGDTAYAREEDREAALQAGFQAHASKPIGAPQLVEIILHLLPGFRP